jgi:hypothetical protein
MQHAPDIVDLDSTAPCGESCLKAFVIYEDVATGKTAKETCDIMVDELGADSQIEIEMFSFKSLYLRRIQHLASAAARNANLIVFSCYDRDLPFEVRQWAESCLTNPSGPTALVALLTGEPGLVGPPRALENYLAALAHRHGMNFFPCCRSPAPEAATGQLMPVIQKDQTITLPAQLISPITVPVDFARIDIRPTPIRICLSRVSRRQSRAGQKRRKPEVVRMDRAMERKS